MQGLDELSVELEEDLVRRYGVLLPSSTLVAVLGYKSTNAYQQALARGTLPVPVFEIDRRRGRFALAKDVARWLAAQRKRARFPERDTDEGGVRARPDPEPEH